MAVECTTLIGKTGCEVAPNVYPDGGKNVVAECLGGGHNQQLHETGSMPRGSEGQVSLQSIAGLKKAELLVHVSRKLGISGISRRR